MVTAPQIYNGSNHGLVGSLSLILMIGSITFLMMAFPHFREKAKLLVSKPEVVEEMKIEEKSQTSRKEIDDFDLSFFED